MHRGWLSLRADICNESLPVRRNQVPMLFVMQLWMLVLVEGLVFEHGVVDVAAASG